MDMAYTQFVESLGYFVYEVTNAEVLSELRAACDEADGSGARGAVSLKEVGLRDGRSAVQAKLAALWPPSRRCSRAPARASSSARR